MTRLEPTPARPARPLWVRLLQAGCAALAVYLTFRLLSSIGWSSLGARMAAARRPPLAAAFAALLLRFAFWDARFRRATCLAIGASTGRLLGCFVLLASAALNLLTPSARLFGGLVRARYVARATRRSVASVFGVVLFDQLAHHAVMIAATWLSLAATAVALHRMELGLAALGSGAALTALVVLATGRRGNSGLQAARGDRLSRALAALAAMARLSPASVEGTVEAKREAPASWRQPLVAHGQEALTIFTRLLAERSLRAPSVAFGMGYFLTNAAAQWLVFAALGEPVNSLTVITVVALGNAAGLFAGTPGGAGTTEAAMVPLYVLLGVGAEAAAAGTLVYRALHYASVLGAGLPALAVLELGSVVRSSENEAEPLAEESRR